jgi:hypothetical protein
MKIYPNVIRDEFERKKFIAVDLVDLYLFNAGGLPRFLHLTTGGIDIVHGGVTYTAQGDFIGFSSVSEDFDVKVGKFTIYLSALGTNMVRRFIDQDIEGRRVRIRKAFLDFDPMTLDVIDEPILVFDGQIMNVQVVESANSATINVDCVTLFADFERTAGRRTNNGSNHLFQGSKFDTAFEKSGFVGNSEFLWGRKQ